MKMTKIFILFTLAVLLLLGSAMGGAIADRLFVIKPLDLILKRSNQTSTQIGNVSNESLVVETAEKASSSVVTVAIVREQSRGAVGADPFGLFGFVMPKPELDGEVKQINQDIGSGFVVEEDGVIVTNKHVVADSRAKYRVITKDDKEYEVKKIYRDPTNDLALLKIEAKLTPLSLGDSASIRVGQGVIAIGTALGEFRHTVTTGVISGLGRGIDTAAGFGGAERLDGVIQTDAAINPGNSGGPLLNSHGQVVGVNVAVATGAQNVGFALPINVVKDMLKQFDETGKFARAYMGLRYKMISQELAVINDLAAGAYVIEVVENSPAKKADIQAGDIITKIADESLSTGDDVAVARIIAKHKVGETLTVELVRSGNKQKVEVVLEESGE